jgi:hypothetical protein
MAQATRGVPGTGTGAASDKVNGEKIDQSSGFVPGEWILHCSAGAILHLEALWDT